MEITEALSSENNFEDFTEMTGIERRGGSHLDEKTSIKINAKNSKFQGIMMDCRNLFAVF